MEQIYCNKCTSGNNITEYLLQLPGTYIMKDLLFHETYYVNGYQICRPVLKIAQIIASQCGTFNHKVIVARRYVITNHEKIYS